MEPVILEMEAWNLNHWPTQKKTGFVTFKGHRAGILLNVGQLGLVWWSLMIRFSLRIFRIWEWTASTICHPIDGQSQSDLAG